MKILNFAEYSPSYLNMKSTPYMQSRSEEVKLEKWYTTESQLDGVSEIIIAIGTPPSRHSTV